MKRYLLLVVAVVLLASCKKNQAGGKSEIKGIVAHHSRFIANARVFVKYNAKELPGLDTNLYDLRIQADGAGNYTFKCYKGDYFLFGYGYDEEYKRNISGGVPVHIRNNEHLVTDVPVTE